MVVVVVVISLSTVNWPKRRCRMYEECYGGGGGRGGGGGEGSIQLTNLEER